jgi:hypothetical protein
VPVPTNTQSDYVKFVRYNLKVLQNYNVYNCFYVDNISHRIFRCDYEAISRIDTWKDDVSSLSDYKIRKIY